MSLNVNFVINISSFQNINRLDSDSNKYFNLKKIDGSKDYLITLGDHKQDLVEISKKLRSIFQYQAPKFILWSPQQSREGNSLPRKRVNKGINDFLNILQNLDDKITLSREKKFFDLFHYICDDMPVNLYSNTDHVINYRFQYYDNGGSVAIIDKKLAVKTQHMSTYWHDLFGTVYLDSNVDAKDLKARLFCVFRMVHAIAYGILMPGVIFIGLMLTPMLADDLVEFIQRIRKFGSDLLSYPFLVPLAIVRNALGAIVHPSIAVSPL
jgi:hypothetical protein